MLIMVPLSKKILAPSLDPTFIKMHLKRSAPNTHLIIFSSKSRRVIDTDYSVVPILVRHLLENPLNNNANNDAYYRLKKKSCFWVVGSCNGLLCLLGYRRSKDMITEYQETWLRFWNPAIKSISKKLGFIGYYCNDPLITCFKFTFGYDNLTDTYKVVAFSHSEARVFSLGDNVWRNIQSFPVVPLFNGALGLNDGVYLSNSLNWLAIRNNINSCYNSKHLTVEQFVIISLDLETETYMEFLPPRGFDEAPIVLPTVCVLMDFLCFSHDSKETDLVIWKTTQFGVEQSWTQFLKINYQSLQIVCSGFVDFEFSQWLPLHFFEKSDTLVMVNDLQSQRQAILYNQKDNRVEQTRVTDEITWKFSRDYVESLVSTC